MDAVPVIARGHNVAVFLPPVTGALQPLLQALARRPILLIAGDRDRALDCALAGGFPNMAVATRTSRPAEPHPSGEAALALGAGDALELMGRSALRPAAFAAVVLAWPEELDDDGAAALEPVLAEAKDAQRIIVTADTGPATTKLIERWAFKAMTFGFPPSEPAPGWTPPGPIGPAQYVVSAATRVPHTVLLAQDALGAEADRRPVAACPASREEARALSARGQPPVVVLTPQQLGWARTLFSPLTPLPLPGIASGVEWQAARLRAELALVAEAGDLERELLVLGPLLERFDPAVVAAAALKLARPAGQGAAGARSAPRSAVGAAGPAPGAAAVPAYARIWVGIGRKDNVKPGDLVGALVNEARVPAEVIGRIEVKDVFCLVVIGSEHAESAARGLTGISVRGRRIMARVDRGPGGGAHRPPRRV